MLQAADLSNRIKIIWRELTVTKFLENCMEKNLSFLLKIYFFLYLQFIELWDPACCQSLHVWICKTGYLQAGLCQQRAGQSCYCWKSRLGFEENHTSHHSDVGSKRAVHKDLEGELPYLQEEIEPLRSPQLPGEQCFQNSACVLCSGWRTEP